MNMNFNQLFDQTLIDRQDLDSIDSQSDADGFATAIPKAEPLYPQEYQRFSEETQDADRFSHKARYYDRDDHSRFHSDSQDE